VRRKKTTASSNVRTIFALVSGSQHAAQHPGWGGTGVGFPGVSRSGRLGVSGGLRRLSLGEQHHKKTNANHDEDDRNNNQEKPSTVWVLILRGEAALIRRSVFVRHFAL